MAEQHSAAYREAVDNDAAQDKHVMASAYRLINKIADSRVGGDFSHEVEDLKQVLNSWEATRVKSRAVLLDETPRVVAPEPAPKKPAVEPVGKPAFESSKPAGPAFEENVGTHSKTGEPFKKR